VVNASESPNGDIRTPLSSVIGRRAFRLAAKSPLEPVPDATSNIPNVLVWVTRVVS